MHSHPSLQSSGILISTINIKKLRTEEKLTHARPQRNNQVRAGIYGSRKAGFIGEAGFSLHYDGDREKEGRQGSKRQNSNQCSVERELEDKL